MTDPFQSLPFPAGAPALWPNEVEKLAEQECCHLISFSDASASFVKVDPACNNYARINVYFDKATVGITLEHRRQGTMQTFRHCVSMLEMRAIFRNPREGAGYPNLNRAGPEALTDFVVGDRVCVMYRSWDIMRGTWEDQKTIVTLTKDPKEEDKVEVLFDTGKYFRVRRNLVNRFVPKPEVIPYGKCLSLKNESRMQLTRLGRELSSLVQERSEVLRLVLDIEKMSEAGMGVKSSGPLWLENVTKLAKEERCEPIHISKKSNVSGIKRACFRKLDVSSNSYARINVYCNEATVGISFYHPRQGTMQVFHRNVSMSDLQEIFHDPSSFDSGYPDLYRPPQSYPSPDLYVGDRVHVTAWREIATVTEVVRHGPADFILVKVLFDNGRSCCFQRNQVSKIALRPMLVPEGKCQSLTNEAKLQLKRLEREIESIELERKQVRVLLDELDRSSSPNSVIANDLDKQRSGNFLRLGNGLFQPSLDLGHTLPILPPDTSRLFN